MVQLNVSGAYLNTYYDFHLQARISGGIQTAPLGVHRCQMCTEAQKERELQLLDRLERTLAGPVFSQKAREPVGYTCLVGNTQSSFFLDYKGFKHVYIWSSTTLHLNLQDIGTLLVTANTWTNCDFRQNTQLFTTDQSTALPIWVLCTDEVIALGT